MSRLLSENIEISGAGRTDAGVHAAGQVANFITANSISCKELLEEVNKYLPEDIAVLDIKEASVRFHSRLNARGKHYRYTILNSKVRDVFAGKYQYKIEEKLDVAAMKMAAEYLIGEHDFKSFCGNPKMKKTTVRRIAKISFTERDSRIIIDYYGNGFLQYMVRIITGTLIEAGLHKRTPESVKSVLAAKERRVAGETAPAQGLCLMEVYY